MKVQRNFTEIKLGRRYKMANGKEVTIEWIDDSYTYGDCKFVARWNNINEYGNLEESGVWGSGSMLGQYGMHQSDEDLVEELGGYEQVQLSLFDS